MHQSKGFTLLEISLSMAILSIVSLLGFIVVRGSTEQASLSQAKSDVQAGLRGVMSELTGELRTAYTERIEHSLVVPANVEAVVVEDGGQSITYQVPQQVNTPELVTGSDPITIRFVNEDANENGRLDQGEDTDGDGALSRRLVREQGGVTRVVGATNDISAVSFQLLPNRNADDDRLTSLRIWLEASRNYGQGRQKSIAAEFETTIDLKN